MTGTILLPLLVTGSFKLRSLCSSETAIVKYLTLPDPVFYFLSNKNMLAIALVLEVAACIIACSKIEHTSKWLFVAWLGGSFLLYRGILFSVGRRGGCNCLGALSSDSIIFSYLKSLTLPFALYMLLLGIVMAIALRRFETPSTR